MQLHGLGTRERIQFAIPRRLSHLVTNERLRQTVPHEAIPLEDAEDLLFAVDAVVSHGAGASMESFATQIVAQAVANGVACVSVGDLAATVLGLRNVLASLFVDAPFMFELTHTLDGFNLMLGVSGRPRASRLLRHFAIGAVHAAARYARQPGPGELRVRGENVADRALVNVVLRDTTPVPAVMRSRPPLARSNPPARLSSEVERILNAPRDSTPPPASELPPSSRRLGSS